MTDLNIRQLKILSIASSLMGTEHGQPSDLCADSYLASSKASR